MSAKLTNGCAVYVVHGDDVVSYRVVRVGRGFVEIARTPAGKRTRVASGADSLYTTRAAAEASL